MKSYTSFYKLILILSAVSVLNGCSGAAKYGEEERLNSSGGSDTAARFDPLDLPQDTQIIPQQYPKDGSITIEKDTAVVSADTSVADTNVTTVIVPRVEIDSLSNQVFRIQLHATEVYGDAKREVQIAEEIFDRKVYLHYEVPYYKVRVGDFASRDGAERYLEKAKQAGYRNAWVMAMKVTVKKAEPLYEDFPYPELSVPIEGDDE